MAKVIVVEFPDGFDFDLQAVRRVLEDAVGGLPEEVVAYAAIREDADAVLAVVSPSRDQTIRDRGICAALDHDALLGYCVDCGRSYLE